MIHNIQAPDHDGDDNVDAGFRMARAALEIVAATGDSYVYICGPETARGARLALSDARATVVFIVSSD